MDEEYLKLVQLSKSYKQEKEDNLRKILNKDYIKYQARKFRQQ